MIGKHCLMNRYRNALFCVMDRYRNACVWFMARNCPFPKVGTHCCLSGNRRLPSQGTACSRKLEVMVPNLKTREVTIASNCRLAEGGTHASQPGNHRLPLQRTSNSERLEQMVPNVGTKGYHGKELPVPGP